jgi:hypothetical protein
MIWHRGRWGWLTWILAVWYLRRAHRASGRKRLDAAKRALNLLRSQDLRAGEHQVGRVALLKQTNRSSLAAEAAYLAQDLDTACIYAQRVLDIKSHLRNEGLRFGEVIGGSDCIAHHILGCIAIANGEVDKAEGHLLAATDTVGSPSLATFGPDLDLAQHLIDLGRTSAVTVYLEALKEIWTRGRPVIESWLQDLNGGKRPRLLNEPAD